MLVKSTVVAGLALLFCLQDQVAIASGIADQSRIDVHSWQWQHGSEDCESSRAPPIEVLQVNSTSFILRQDKCSHFEAPFIYLLIGSNKALLLDTGATADAAEFPLYREVKELISGLRASHQKNLDEIIVMHSHHHRDHYAGDEQFLNQTKFTVVAADRDSVAAKFDFPASSTEPTEINLGDRKINLIPIPGHQRDSIALFDHTTGWLLTGDTLYPGSIRVKDWNEFKKSINRLSAFSEQHQVSAILGGHIEMRSDKPKIYSIGSTFQPKELPLALKVGDLVELNSELQKTTKSKTLRFEKFIISPLNFLERQLQKVLSKRGKDLENLSKSTLAVAAQSGANQSSNAFVRHQFQQQRVINSPIDYV